MKKIKISILFLLVITTTFAQKQGNIWIFGEGAGLNFNSGSPIPINGTQIYGNPTQFGDYPISEGTSSIADSSGRLLFYSNGEKVWNRNNVIMPNGSGLMGFYSSTSSSFIIPKPSSDSIYYLFTTDGLERFLVNGLRYSIVNICSDGGKGDVDLAQKNILLLDTVSEKLCAIAHPNGIDIWLVAHKYYSDAFYVYKITPTGIDPPLISNIGSIHASSGGGTGAAIGQMKASSNGNKIGLVFTNTYPSVGEVFDFNPLTGLLSNVIHLNTSGNDGIYGFEFSQDNTKIYYTSMNGLHQFDLTAGGGIESSINLSKTQITSEAVSLSPMLLAPNGKIYITRGGGLLTVINNPNNLGASCNFVTSTISISPANQNTSLPLFIAGYNYKNNKIPECVVTSVINELTPEKENFFPNPFSSNTILKSKYYFKNASINIFNSVGQKVKQIENINGYSVILKREDLSSGIYFVELIENNNIISTHKIIVSD